MIALSRLAEPAIVTEKKADWQTKYAEKRAAAPTARPDSSKYAHAQIVQALEVMSHGKCFYCESNGDLTVDHHIEVAEREDLAFTWNNLFLACKGCQAKIPNKSIPVTACVDPCDSTTSPDDHLKGEAEYIRFRTGRGEETIKKYRLNRDPLVSERRRMLQRFNEELIDLGKTKAWPTMTAEEREHLLRYRKADHPFSLMFAAYLDRLDLRAP